MRRALSASLLLLGTVSPALAQNDRTLPPGVQLAGSYTTDGRDIVAVRSFSALPAIRPAADQVTGIITNDLKISNRYQMIATPAALAEGAVDYAAWNSLNVMYLVAGDVTATASGYELALTIHDVVYGNVKQVRSYTLPATTAPGFRMAVHVISDEIVRMISNQPGSAATRITFARQNGGGSYDLLVVDSDGEEMRRLQGSQLRIYSPVWSPDAKKMAYALESADGSWQLLERDMATGASKRVAAAELLATPTYLPDGRLVFAMWLRSGRDYGFELHVANGSSVERLTNTNGDNISPSVSPDGRQLAFHSTRTGRQHVFVMPVNGGDARLVSPIGDRAEFAAPDWSPTGNQIVFHGMSRDVFHLMMADAARPGTQVTQLTTRGRNEDASWAPDGRHIVFTGVGAEGAGLYVIDIVTGDTRLLVRGAKLRMADWSPSVANEHSPGARTETQR